MSSAGRPRALDEVKQAELCALMSQGCDVERAARYVGCSASTIRRELRRNKEFNKRLSDAVLSAELDPLRAVRRAAQKHWRAGAWLLERMNPQRFGKQNVRFIKPRQLQAFIEEFANTILDEAQDAEACRRVERKVKAFAAKLERETRAAQLDPFPKPRRQPQIKPQTTTAATQLPLPCREACGEHVEQWLGEGLSPSNFSLHSPGHPSTHTNHASTVPQRA